jgi:hypothetical protein
MPYSLFLLQLINLVFGGLTGWAYWHNINLWHDQGVFLFGLSGGFTSGLTLMLLGWAVLAKTRMGLLPLFFNGLLAFVLFSGQSACLLYIWLQKPI